MPRIRYAEAVAESEPELAALERELRGQRTRPRVQMLRLLKAGQARSLVAVAPLLGYGERTVNRRWKLYRAGGLAALLAQRPRPGRRSRLTAAAWAGLDAAMRRGEIATLADAQRYLREQWQIEYRSLQGVWWQLRRRKARPKTGRRRHRQADPAQQDAYKRRLRRDA
jgi:transposase